MFRRKAAIGTGERPGGQTEKQVSGEHTARTYSLQSQNSVIAVERLKAKVNSQRNAIAIVEKKIADAEREVRRLTDIVDIQQNEITRPHLEEKTRELAGFREQLSGQKASLAELEAKIAGMNPTPGQIEARAAAGEKFEHLAILRNEIDAQIDPHLRELRSLLEQRNMLSPSLAEAAEAFDLQLPSDALDTSRFERLLSSLPKDMLTASTEWFARIVGKPLNSHLYIVRLAHLVRPESLVHSGIYHFGEEIPLTKEEAEDLLCEDYYMGGFDHAWRCYPPRVMSVEDFRAAQAEAEKRNISVEDICFWADVARDQANEAWFRKNAAPRSQKPRPIRWGDNITFVDERKIKAKVTGNLSLRPAPDGSSLLEKIGSIVEMSRSAIWPVVASRAVGPPW
jgi:hypothetical protein